MNMICRCGPRSRSPISVTDSRPHRARRAGPSADPTGTLPIQGRFQRDLESRWNRLRKLIPVAIARSTDPVGVIAHSQLTGDDPVRAFQSWIDEAMRQLILGINGSWTLSYVRGAGDVALHRASGLSSRVRDAFDPNQPRDKDGKWTSGEHDAVLEYVVGDQKKLSVNAKLRAGKSLSSDEQEYVKNLESAIQKNKTEKDMVLYRGSSDEHGGIDKGFVSLSRDPKVAKAFGKHLMEVHVPKGTPHLDVSKHVKTDDPETLGGIEEEKEIVLGRGHKFVRSGVGDNAGGRITKKFVLKDSVVIRDASPTLDRVPALQTLCVIELQGIMEAVSQQAVRAFAQGLLARQSASSIGRAIENVISTIAKNRSRLLISFICVRTHSAVTLDAFRAAGVTHVGTVAERARTIPPPVPSVLARDAKHSKKSKTSLSGFAGLEVVEVLTAGDDNVCQVCEDISDEGPYDLDDAEELIPAHPNCRCAFVPADDARFASVHDAFNPDEPRDQRGRWTEGGDLDIDEDDDSGDIVGIDAKKFESLYYYQDKGYNSINKSLRSGKMSDSVRKHVQAIDSVIKTSVMKKEMTVYRGIDNSKQLNIDDFQPGKTMKLKGYSSTSSSKELSKEFLGSDDSIMFKITVPKGAKALEIKSEERELLLPRDSKFRVVEVKRGVTYKDIDNAERNTNKAYNVMERLENKPSKKKEYATAKKEWQKAEREFERIGASDDQGHVVHLELIK